MDEQRVTIEQQQTPPAPRWNVTSTVLIGTAIALMIYAVLAGLWLQPDYFRLGPEGLFGQRGSGMVTAFWLWLFSLPVAMILGVIGASIAAHARAGRIWALGLGGVVFLMVPIIAGAIIGRSVAPIFGAGGILIELFLLLSLWFWAKERAALTGKRQVAADLRLAGYMLFAFAAWYVCGIGSMPVLALYPEKMIAFDMLPLATNMMYGILAYLVLGWGFIFASQYVAGQAAVRGDGLRDAPAP
jgi:hypothetical protein